MDFILNKCVCPRCHGTLKEQAEKIFCRECQFAFPMHDGIPNLIIPEKLSGKMSRIRESYDKTSKRYRDSPKSCGYTDDSDQLTRYHILQRLLNKNHLEGKVILDIGCGTGMISRGFVNKNEVWGIDISPPLLNIARRKGLYGVLASADLLPFRDREFDLVLCVGVIPYYRSPEKIFSEICRVTRKNAKMVITSTANSWIIRSVLRLKKMLFLSTQITHLYSIKEIETHIQNCGGEILASCAGYKDHTIMVQNTPLPLKYRIMAYSSAVMATIKD